MSVVEEKRFKLTRALSAVKRGPSGEVYHFIKDRPIGAINLRDEQWMELLCLDINKNFLTCVTDEISTEVKRNVISLEDVLHREVVIPDPSPVMATRSKEEIDAELALIESEKRMAELEAENTVRTNLTYEYLTEDSLETVNKAIAAIEAYLEESTISQEYKVAQIEKYIAEDSRKTLHSRVEELLGNLNWGEEDEKKIDEEEEEFKSDEETGEETGEVHRVSREEE